MNSGSLADADRPGAAAADTLHVRGVSVHFGGIVALDNVSLTAQPRQVTGIIGPNGAGKTTLLNVLCGFVRPQGGSISFGGRELARIRPHRLAGLGIARTLQGVGLFSGLSALENVMVGATTVARAGFWSGLLGLPRSDADEKRLRALAQAALEQTGAGDYADAMPDTLAHGLRKRIALARALVARPRLLLLDEPASGLAEDELGGLGDLITSLAQECTVVVIEHRMDLMMSVCQEIFVLDFGKVISSGTPEQVQADPAVTAAYLGTDAETVDAGAGDAGAGDAGAGDAGAGDAGAGDAGAGDAGAGDAGTVDLADPAPGSAADSKERASD
jgi:branched-chain amino acid transport system ATP-binding protein